MWNSIWKPIVLTCLISVSLSDCAFLVLGPLEISQQNPQNTSPGDNGIQSKTVPKRESKEKQKTVNSTSTTNDLDDIEIIDEVPYCTNLFRSSNCPKTVKSSGETNKGKDEICDSIICNKDKLNEKVITSEDNFSLIEHLKRELAEEREKVQNLTNELKLAKKVCDDSPISYMDYEYDNPNKMQSIDSSLDLFNLINSKNSKVKTKYGNKNSEMNLSADKSDMALKNNESQFYFNNARINKHLFRDNVYQIPNFAVNEHKNFKNPTILNDMPVFNPTLGSYNAIPMHNPHLLLPFKHHKEQGDILRTLYPQFFIDDANDVYDSITNPKRDSGRSWLEPDQIYANNMKRLTAPYKIFPSRLNPDFRFLNIRDRRNSIRNLRNRKCLKENSNLSKGNLTVSRHNRQNKENENLSKNNKMLQARDASLIKVDFTAEPDSNLLQKPNKFIKDGQEIEEITIPLKLDVSKHNLNSDEHEKDDLSKLGSSAELNDRSLKPDFEDRDVDSKASYFESSKGTRLYQCSKDYVDAKKSNDLALDEWSDTKYIPKFEIDLDDDKNAIETPDEIISKNVEIVPDAEFAKNISPSKHLKLTLLNSNGNKKKSTSLKIYNREKSDKLRKNNYPEVKTVNGDQVQVDDEHLLKQNKLVLKKVRKKINNKIKNGPNNKIEHLENENKLSYGNKELKIGNGKLIAQDDDEFDEPNSDNDETLEETDDLYDISDALGESESKNTCADNSEETINSDKGQESLSEEENVEDEFAIDKNAGDDEIETDKNDRKKRERKPKKNKSSKVNKMSKKVIKKSDQMKAIS